MAEYVREYLTGCRGVNLVLPDEQIADNELADVRNLVPSPTGVGSLKKRRGISKYNSNMTSTRTHIGSIYAGLYGPYYTDQSAANWDIKGTGGTSLQAGTATVAFPCWRTFNGADLVVDGTNAYKTTNGTAFSAIANIPSGVKYIESYNRFLFAAGHASYTLRWADMETIETWTASNSLTFDPSEADAITGLKSYGTVLAIFLNHRFHFLQGYAGITDFTITLTNSSIGSLTNRSLVVSPFGLFFWSDRGLALTTDGRSIDTITLRKLGEDYVVPQARATDIHGVWDSYNGCVHMYFPYPSGTACNLRMDYYPSTDSVYLQDGAAAQMACSAYISIP